MKDLRRYQPYEASQDQIGAAYAAYFRSGHYKERYPSPNPTIWRNILAHTDAETHMIDYGCGAGRYLLALREHVGKAAGFDVSPEALRLLRENSADWSDLSVLGPEPEALDHYLDSAGPADLVLCLFGVIGHVIDPETRHAVLCQIRRAVKHRTGRLLISVPNIARRFRAEQREAVDGCVTYTRRIDGDDVTFRYQLFDTARLMRELSAAGFTVTRVAAESVFAENWLLTKPWARALDAILTPICPARWGYGLYAEASC